MIISSLLVPHYSIEELTSTGDKIRAANALKLPLCAKSRKETDHKSLKTVFMAWIHDHWSHNKNVTSYSKSLLFYLRHIGEIDIIHQGLVVCHMSFQKPNHGWSSPQNKIHFSWWGVGVRVAKGALLGCLITLMSRWIQAFFLSLLVVQWDEQYSEFPWFQVECLTYNHY